VRDKFFAKIEENHVDTAATCCGEDYCGSDRCIRAVVWQEIVGAAPPGGVQAETRRGINPPQAHQADHSFLISLYKTPLWRRDRGH
jgi:hypothetical protein